MSHLDRNNIIADAQYYAVLGKDVQLIFNYILQIVHDLALCLNEKGQTGFRIS